MWVAFSLCAAVIHADAKASGQGGQDTVLKVHVGQASLIAPPLPVSRVSVTDPTVADVEAIGPQRVLILGKKIGTTDLFLWGDEKEVERFRIDVQVDLERIRSELNQLFTLANLDVKQSQDVITITGTVTNEQQNERLDTFLKASESATGLKYVNLAEAQTAARGQEAHLAPGGNGNANATEEPEVHYIDPQQLRNELAEIFPDFDLTVRRSQDVIAVQGTLPGADQARQLDAFLQAVESSLSERATRADREMDRVKFVNMTTVAGVQQVIIQVRVAEVSRSALRVFGIQGLWRGHHRNSFFGYTQVGPASGGALNPISVGPPAGQQAGPTIATRDLSPFVFNADVNVSPLTTMVLGIPRAELQFFIQALAENQYLRVLAEPTLVAMSGEMASFLAGGEIPVPVVQGTVGGASTGTSISIEWREFGVRLQFRPTVLGNNGIRLHVAPEVSDLSDQGAVELQGFQIPSLLTRRAETTLEMHSGQTFLMAGLLNQRDQARNSRVPGLGDVPILGALFRSSRYLQGETELAVLVTATLVEPMSVASSPPVPGIFHVPPNDWEFFAKGKLASKSPAVVSPEEAKWLQDMGLDGLKGPGAWVTYEQEAAPSRAPRRTVTTQPG